MIFGTKTNYLETFKKIHNNTDEQSFKDCMEEIDYDIDSYIIERMKRTMTTGKHHFIIIVAEGVKGVEVGSLAKYIEENVL